MFSKLDNLKAVLRDAGSRHMRVRHHRNLARIEVGAEEFPRLSSATPSLSFVAVAGISLT